jgi:hypothetical protein
MFEPDKKYLVIFQFDSGKLQSQQLNCWASAPTLTKESAQRRLAYQRFLQDLSRIQVQEIKAL